MLDICYIYILCYVVVCIYIYIYIYTIKRHVSTELHFWFDVWVSLAAQTFWENIHSLFESDVHFWTKTGLLLQLTLVYLLTF